MSDPRAGGRAVSGVVLGVSSCGSMAGQWDGY